MKNKFLLLLFFYFLIPVKIVLASDFSIVPNSSNVNLGSNFWATVFIDTKGKSINNAEAIINFPKDYLEVISTEKTGSIFNFWLEDPKFSNSLGKISFNGGLPNPGYTGSKGNVVRINFKAKKAGQATISFLSGNIRLNDGLGTDDTDSKIGTSIEIKQGFLETLPIVPIDPVELIQTPISDTENIESVSQSVEVPVIVSENAPDENAWYSTDKVSFEWELPKGINAIQLLYGKRPDSIPSVLYIPPIKSKTIDELRDGTYYFHARFKKSNTWGETAHRKINIDTTKPNNLSIDWKITQDDLLALEISASDELSGIKKYEILSDDNQKPIEILSIGEKGKTDFILPPLKSGEREIAIKAYDYAGNYIQKEIKVNMPSVDPPEIIEYREEVDSKQTVDISGKTKYKQTAIQIWANGKKMKELMSDSNGNFSCSCSLETCENYEALFSSLKDSSSKKIVLSVKAKVVRRENVESDFSNEAKITINKKADFSFPVFQMPEISINGNTIMFVLMGIMFVLMGILYNDLKKFKKTKKILNRDLEQTEIEVKKILEVIQNEIRNSNKLLKKASGKRQQALNVANKEEYKILEQLSKNIDIAERYFSEKMKNIADRD